MVRAASDWRTLRSKKKVRVPRARMGICPPLIRWAFHTIMLLSSWRKISVRRTLGTASLLQDVAEHVARAHAGQLVRIAHQNQARARHHRAEGLA